MWVMLVCFALCNQPRAGWFGDGRGQTEAACLADARAIQVSLLRFVVSCRW